METINKYLNKRVAEQTAQSYLYCIDVFLIHNPNAKTFLYNDIINYIAEIKKKSPEIVLSAKFAAIKCYYDYLLETGQRNDHPCRSIQLKQKKKAIQIQDLFTSTELETLMNRENRYINLELRNKVIGIYV